MPTDLSIACLSASDYISPLGIEAGGQTALTHRALINTKSGQRRAYVKAYPESAPKGLINEIIGYTLAYHAGLPQPAAYLIVLPTPLLEKIFPSVRLEGEKTPCFVSIEAEDIGKRQAGSAKAIFGEALPPLRDALKAWPHFPLMIAFDAWLANIDRNTGNLLVYAENRFMLIDHGHLLTGPNWQIADLKHNEWTANKLLELVFDPKSLPLPIKSAILKSADDFLKVYGAARSELYFWLSGQSLSDNHRAHHYIWARTEHLGSILKAKVKLVA